MSADKAKPIVETNKPAVGKSGGAQPPKQPNLALPPLFRPIDWLTFGLAVLLAFVGYYLTLAPEVTLQDSGELATGSFYAGVPHPPGYPLWTIFTWLFTKLVPVANVAYRVALASAVSGALAVGLLGLVVSRGSSMIIEGIAEFKDIPHRLEDAICVVSGLVAGMLLAYNGYMWSQSVIVEVYPFSVLSLMGVMCLLLRWTYAPHQRGYLYWAWLLFGVCFTNHQTLIVAAMGIEGAIIAGQPKLGRDLLLANSAVYIIGCFALYSKALGVFEPNPMVITIFHIVGVCSIIGCAWLAILTKKIGTELAPVLIMFSLWVVGAGLYFYMPLTSMSNPPMNWGYPRTVEGFIHALTRGQYEKANPTNFFNDPQRFLMQLGMYLGWAVDEFNLVNLGLALIPIVFFLRMQRRERAWLTGLASIWFCLAILLLILLNPAPDRASRDLNKVFFSASFTVISIFAGYGVTMIAATMCAQYARFRLWFVYGGIAAAGLALITLTDTTQHILGDTRLTGFTLFFHAIAKSFQPNQYGLPILAGLLLLGLTCLFIVVNLVFRSQPPLTLALGILALLPGHSMLSHWADNEQRGHLFGYWFGHDMFSPPFGVYPEMTRNAILFGGTDPGRFCPTYMIFCESFIPPEKKPYDPNFDRRDVYIITQNALADGTYLEYIRAQYNRSTQMDPPFFQELLRSHKEVEQNYTTNFVARLAYQLLDKPFTSLGAKIESRRRREGVYPPKEIYTPNTEDSQESFNEYLKDAQQRLYHDTQFPNEPKQIKPGEDVHAVDNRVSVSGQVAVMSINGLLTKVIFDHNPNNEFFVEESFPLDWMYPHLTPFGDIMKINRQPLAEFSDEIISKDHEFWSRYSDRLIGNWITYDTGLKEITDFVEKVYLERDFNGFKGDRRFIRDDDAQKAFSKLRSSVGGIYDWRVKHAKSPADQQRMLKEADFAYRQAFAFCPFSPEAVFRYVSLLVNVSRFDDALLVAATCLKLDPNNTQVEDLVRNLTAMKNQQRVGVTPQPTSAAALQGAVQQLEREMREHPTNFQAAFNLVGTYLQTQQTNKAVAVLDQVLANPKVDEGTVIAVAKAFSQLSNYPKLETALERLTQVSPHSPEAWYDLAAMKQALGNNAEALQDLRHAMAENAKRLSQNPKAPNLQMTLQQDARFNAVRASPEFQQMVAPK